MRKTLKILGHSLMICLLSSCIPVFDSYELMRFKNCTNDTLYIGASFYDNIDSVFYPLNSECPLSDNYAENIDSLWNERIFVEDFICPDSMCTLDAYCGIKNVDTCYFFMVKYSDSKRYSWDEIRAKKLYGKCITTRNKDGEFDRNIRYTK